MIRRERRDGGEVRGNEKREKREDLEREQREDRGLTLNNARVVRELLIFLFSRNFILEVRAFLKIIVKTTASVASNDAPYER